ncbi:hypothetical protein QPK87_37240 [Kamptonema cortianum]|nr:hypothetical protein [Geitlerinema splendidum]MDK3162154.1 hypothetical protein [Kamptonema cortianum]
MLSEESTSYEIYDFFSTTLVYVGLRKVVEDRIAGLSIPPIINYPFGHMQNMLSLPMGARVRLDADAGVLAMP